MEDETKLIEQARRGDKAALAHLVESHFQPIYRVALRMCGNVDDAEETLQDTFLNAIKALPTFEGRAQISTWLYRIASNACLMRRRQAGEQKLHSGTMAAGITETIDNAGEFLTPRLLANWSAQPLDIALDHELQEVVQAALAELPPTLRIVFLWRDLEGLSTAETAQVLDISEAAVKVRLHRARLQLRAALARYFSGHFPPPPAEPNIVSP